MNINNCVMIDTKLFVDSIMEEFGLEEFVGVPCSNLKYIINYLSNIGKYKEVANEGDAVAYSVGAYAVGKRVGVLMQNSGLTNALSPMTSLANICGVPIIYLVGHRGDVYGNKDEPQHQLMGKVTEKWLMDCGVRAIPVTSAINYNSINIEHTDTDSIAFLVPKGLFSKVELKSNYDKSLNADISRSDVLSIINKVRDENTVVVTSTGFMSRDMYCNYDNDNNFYMVGSMGEALAIGKGIADHSDKKVIVVDGDGSLLMRPSTLVLDTIGKLYHLVLNNHQYETTGGQSTLSISNIVNVESLMRAGDRFTDTIIYRSSLGSLENQLKRFVSGDISNGSLQILTSPSDNNKSLGRPKESTQELFTRFKKSNKE